MQCPCESHVEIALKVYLKNVVHDPVTFSSDQTKKCRLV